MRDPILRPRPAPFRGSACALGLAVVVVTAAAYANQQRARQQEQAALNANDTAAAAASGGVVSGRVAVPAGQRLPEMVVFLESTDPGYAFAPPAEPVVVSQRDAKFDPGLVVVPVGTRVDFRNDERRPIEHNVFSRTPGSEFDLGLYKPGAADKVVKFDTPGPVRLYCSIHRYMDGVVYVCPTPLFAEVGRDGSYRIDNVPPGEYRLKTWQRNARFADREVFVKMAGGAAPVELNLEMSRK